MATEPAPAPAHLLHTRYGKSRVRLLKVTRERDRSEIHEWTVQILLEGDFDRAHTHGDNSLILTTDTLKNTVYSRARASEARTMEAFGLELTHFLLGRNPQIRSVRVHLEAALWKRLTLDGQPHPDTFMRGSAETQTATVDHTRDAPPAITAGFRDLHLLKTANSAFSGYLQDDLTTLPETRDRVFGTAVDARWQYSSAPADFDRTRSSVREAMLRVFAGHQSESVQHTLHEMAQAAFLAAPELARITLAMPNKHCLLVDLSRFGQTNPNQIFVPTDEPHGYIEATLTRTDLDPSTSTR